MAWVIRKLKGERANILCKDDEQILGNECEERRKEQKTGHATWQTSTEETDHKK